MHVDNDGWLLMVMSPETEESCFLNFTYHPKFRNGGPRNARNSQKLKALPEFQISLDG